MQNKVITLRGVFEGHAHQVLYCRTKKRQGLKTHINTNKKQARGHKNHQKTFKTHVNNSKNEAKSRDQTPRYSHPGGPALRTTVYMRPRSFASPARTTRTKRKRRRNEADLPVTGGRINRSNSPKPPIYTCTYIYNNR